MASEIEEISDIMDKFDFIRSLGAGKFGTVGEYRHKETGKTVAVKKLNSIADGIREAGIMSMLDHPNVIKLESHFKIGPDYYLAMELCNGSSLANRIDKKKKYKESEAVVVINQLLSGLKHCHDHNVSHNDIKPDNLVFEDESGSTVKIIDFGLARILKEGETGMDMNSVGVLLYHMISGLEFKGLDYEIHKMLREGKFKGNKSPMSDACFQLLEELFQKDAKLRITADRALAHVWVTQVGPATTEDVTSSSCFPSTGSCNII